MKTKCESCGTKHKWDSCQDSYPACESKVIGVSKEVSIELYFCPCKAVLAVFVNDERGGSLYVPCTEDL